MYGLLTGVGRDTATRSARSALANLMESVGTAGLAASAASPRLLAAVDQHTAAIRDSLRDAGSSVSGPALAGYAEGLREAAIAHGWQLPAGPVDWSDPDWMSTRLLAVCALGRAGGPAPDAVPPPADERPTAA